MPQSSFCVTPPAKRHRSEPRPPVRRPSGALRHGADQHERPEGVEAKAAVLAENLRAALHVHTNAAADLAWRKLSLRQHLRDAIA